MPSKDIAKTSAYKWAETQQNKHMCRCGCRNHIKVTWYHYHEGVPSYINGHSAKIKNKKPPVNSYNFFPYVNVGKKRLKLQMCASYYYYIYRDAETGNQIHLNLGCNIKEARQALRVFYRAKLRDSTYRGWISLLEKIKKTAFVNITELQSAKIDTSLADAKSALAQLRNAITHKQKELNTNHKTRRGGK